MAEYVVRYESMVIEADTADDAISRAMDSSGGNWEAIEQTGAEISDSDALDILLEFVDGDQGVNGGDLVMLVCELLPKTGRQVED